MTRQTTLTSVYTGLLLAVLGVLAWASGYPFVFPSLGPTAFLLARLRRSEALSPRRVIVGHTFGVLGGLLAYHLFAPGVVVTDPIPPFSPTLLFLTCSAVTSVVLTAACMLATDAVHPPACATTLIVSLGLLSTPTGGAVILGAVVVLVAVHKLVLAIVGSRLERVAVPDG